MGVCNENRNENLCDGHRGLISGKFNEKIRINVLSLSGINPQDSPASIWQQGHFFTLFHFPNRRL